MREMGGLRRHMPVTWTTFLIGSLALAGVMPFSGFFSKDEILAVLLHEHHYAVFACVILASALTAFYMTRLWFRVFAWPAQSEHLHDGSVAMLAPMTLLATITLVVGFATTLFAAFLGHEGEFPSTAMFLISFAIAGTGIGVGWWFYGRPSVVVNTQAWKQRFGYFYGTLSQKFYFDLTYERIFIQGFTKLADRMTVFDQKGIDGVVNGAARAWVAAASGAWRFDGKVIDGAVNGLATLAKAVGTSARRIQTGRLQSYQRLVVGAVVLLMLILVVTRGA